MPSPLTPPESFHLAAAQGWLELGSVAEARVELGLLEGCPDHPDIAEVWWQVLALERAWEEAWSHARALMQLAPERASGWINGAFALHEMGRTREALELLAPAAERFSGRENFVIPYNVACYLCRLGDTRAAMEWVRRAAELAGLGVIKEMAIADPDLAACREEIAALE